MSFATRIPYLPKTTGTLSAPFLLRSSDVSVVVPVRDNRSGAQRLLGSLVLTGASPREVIFVDNLSGVPLRLNAEQAPFPVRVATCDTPGPASARNAGAALASGDWLLFLDSDCIARPRLIEQYARHLDGSLAYAGGVTALGSDPLSAYYQSQEILVPRHVEPGRPHYLVTANALVWREAFERVDGFDEGYPSAAGEDVDLGLRLGALGRLAYADSAIVAHDFGDGWSGFARRFVRYGAGNRRVGDRFGVDMTPRPFAPNRRSVFNWVVAAAQYALLWWGYHSAEFSTLSRSRMLRATSMSCRVAERAAIRPSPNGGAKPFDSRRDLSSANHSVARPK